MADRASGSIDKGKRPLSDDDIEEGEFVCHPWEEPAPQVPSGEAEPSGAGTKPKKKKKKKRTIDSETHARNVVKTFVNAKIRHTWFLWFVQSPLDKEHMKNFWTPGQAKETDVFVLSCW